MELKKSVKADLESRRGIFFQLGLIFSMAVVLIAFEWKSYDDLEITTFSSQRMNSDVEELTQITRQNTPPAPPPPPVPSMVLNVVENTAEINDDISIDAEADENTRVDEYKPPSSINQEDEAEIEEQQIFMIVENAPVFPGGEAGLSMFLQNNIKYPQMAKERGIQGTVYVGFVVERSGAVTDVKILRGIGGGADEEALRVVMNMPRWEPGKQRGKPVRVQFNLPIKFALGNL